jgi:single-strand DNA-binding protein
MSFFNQVILVGNLGKDPEVLQVSELGSFVRLSLATNKKFKTKEGEIREDTQWHTVYLNNSLGRVAAATLKKGAKLLVSGELRTRDWKDKEGQVHRLTAVYAKEMKFLSAKPQDETHQDEAHDALDQPQEDNADEHQDYKKAKQEIDHALDRVPVEEAA